MDVVPLNPQADVLEGILRVSRRMERAYVDVRRLSGSISRAETDHFIQWLGERSVAAILPAYVLARAGDSQADTLLAAARMAVHQEYPLPPLPTVPLTDFAALFAATTDLPVSKFDLFAGLLYRLAAPTTGTDVASEASENKVWASFSKYELATLQSALLFEFSIEPRSAASHVGMLLETRFGVQHLLDFAADYSIKSSPAGARVSEHFLVAYESVSVFLSKHKLQLPDEVVRSFSEFIRASPDCTDLASSVMGYLERGLLGHGDSKVVGSACIGLPPLGQLLVQLIFHNLDNAGPAIAFAMDNVARRWSYPGDKSLPDGVAYCLFKGLEIAFDKGSINNVVMLIDSIDRSTLKNQLNMAQYDQHSSGFVAARNRLADKVADPDLKRRIAGFLRR